MELFQVRLLGGIDLKVESKDLEETAQLLKLLGDKTRLTMVKILDSRETCVCEFVELFKVSQPAVSQHLRKLKDLGLVTESRKCQWIMYSLNNKNTYYPILQDILKHIPDQAYRLADDIQIKCGI